METQDTQRPKIFTEGKTDWKHIKKANEVLQVCRDISFYEDEGDIGDQNLLNMCQTYAKIMQSSPMIFIFDRDNKDILKKVSDDGAPYKSWNNNVYSVVIPLPPFRAGYQSLSIEMLYKDDDVTIGDPHGRRLFFSWEFDTKSGNNLKTPSLHVGNVNKLKGFSGKSQSRIIDSDIAVYDETNNNIAMSKSDFAQQMVDAQGEFANVDFRGFRELLQILQRIIRVAAPESDSREAVPSSAQSQKGSQSVVVQHQIYRRDHPPHIPVFVGRIKEIETLDDISIRVSAITGLGGEGKSSLASRFFKMAQKQTSKVQFEKCGWCDCKELESSFHERLLVLLEELTEGKESRQRYSDEPVNDTISRFIGQLHSKECLVVFDNVDAFVDRNSFAFIDTIKILFDAITATLSRSLVIFTCRPSIHDFHSSFLEVPMQGLTETDCKELSIQLGISITEPELIYIHEHTKGHALWLNLVFAQIRSRRISPERIQSLLKPESSLIADLNLKLLGPIWSSLAPKEKHILSVISTFTRPKSMDHIELASEISFDKCRKLLNRLVALRLVLEVDSEGTILYDLHPIIRAKARQECGRSKMKSLTARVIAILVPGGIPSLAVLVKSKEFSRMTVESYIECAEVAVENGDYLSAAKYLNELSDSLWRVGEEAKFIDLAKRFLEGIDRKEMKIGIDETITEVFRSFIHVLLELGNFALAEKELSQYQTSIQSINQYIFYVELRGYNLWFSNEHQEAISLMKDGIREIKQKGEEIPTILRTNYALALRDGGQVDKAIEIFLEGREWPTLENWDVSAKEDISTDLGNLGRCLFIKGEFDRALNLIQKSADILVRGESKTDVVNYGYALLWLSDILVGKGDWQAAYGHLTHCVEIWSEHAPARLTKIRTHISTYPKKFLETYKTDELFNH